MTTFNGAFNLGFALSALGFGTVAEAAGFRLVFLISGALTATGLASLALLPRATSTR